MQLPPLPPLNDKLHLLMRGPTMASNWVIPGLVMAGAFPGALEDKENELQLKCILSKGIDTFVCLQSEVDDEVPEEQWRAGYGLRPYFTDARRLSKKPLVWRHLPIIDGGAAPDDVMEALICDLVDDVKAGKVLYVHCWGGHGRTGIVVCLMLAVLYGMPISEAFKRVQGYHDCRVEPQGVKSPQTVVQRSQVKRLLQKWKEDPQATQTETSLDPDVSSAPTEPEPVLIIAKNGTRGFVVPPTMDRTASMPNSEPLRRNRMKGPLSKQQPNRPVLALSQQLRERNSSSAPQREITMQQSQSTGALATRLNSGRAAGTGAAAIQMIRKSSKGELQLFK